jgi:predicted nucleotide-binding protein (sugar kinase/HSP70/actin superfamily)
MSPTTATPPNVLDGRTLYVPRMTYIGARVFTAAFRSAGIDARMVEPSDDKTLEWGALYSSGEECYPQKVTMGDFMRIVHAPGFDPGATAFFMPIAEGPCRFGQYAPYLRHVLRDMGYGQIPVISPTSKNSYGGLAAHAPDMVRRLWRAIVAGDILRKMLLRTRPYETTAGAADATLEASLDDLDAVLERPDLSPREQMAAMVETLTACRDRFRNVPAHYTADRVLIGVVGEIFCRLNSFSNDDALRKIEAHGGEAWLSDMCEWVWYTNWGEKHHLRRQGKRLSLAMLKAVVRDKVQADDEHALFAPFAEDFLGYEEPHDIYQEVLKPVWGYLPADGAIGEMVLTLGKSAYLQRKGADGIIDISPFSCMNGIVNEAIHPALSRDCDGMPIRSFYFDDSSSNLQRDLDIFMELARGYNRRKTVRRVYPAVFGG